MARKEGTSQDEFISTGNEWDEIYGNGGNDQLHGNGGNDTIYGGDGDDIITGDDGGDTWFGGADYLSGGDGNDEIHGGNEDDFVSGGDGNDELHGDDGNDHVKGGAGNDELSGGWGDDLLEGGTGNDTITAIMGVDDVYGGDGDDEIRVHGDDGYRFDYVEGGSGLDTIDVTGHHVIAEGNAGADTFRTDLNDYVYLVGGSGNDRFVLTEAMFDHPAAYAEIYGSEATVMRGYVGGVEVVGGVEIDTDIGTDTLDMSELDEPGRFTVDLAEGTLTHSSSPGTRAILVDIENVVGSDAADNIFGDSGSNTIEGEAGSDDIEGRGGIDYIYGDAGNDEIDGGSGEDFLFGGADHDTIFGGTNQDVLHGDAGNDTLSGGDGSDYLIGGAGSDVLRGGDGADILYGDFYGDAVSADTLRGGEGADTFVFVDVASSRRTVTIGNQTYTFSAPVVDTILDFDTSGADHDMINLDALLSAKANFNGTYQQAVDQGYLYFRPTADGQGTRVMIDVNGGQVHTDTANNFAVADLVGIDPAAMRAELFLV